MRTLWQRKWLVIVAVVVAVGVAVALSVVSTKIYAATAQIVSESKASADVGTHVEVLKSRPIATEVSRRLGDRGAAVSAVKVHAVGNTRVIDITVESTDPVVATDAATTYANVYIEQRRAAQKTDVQLVEEAEVPTNPIQPRPVRNALLAFALGLVVGVGAAFVFERLDDAVKSASDLERHAEGVRLLGAVPAFADWRDRDVARLVTVEAPTAFASEGYRAVQTGLQFVAMRQKLRTVLITSPMPEEGKTATLANLAVVLAAAGQRVICVDCDLRHPRLHDFFGLTNAVGFTSVLLGDSPLSASLKEVDVAGTGSLRVLASGPLPPSPAELLATSRVAELLTAVSADADIVLVDTSAALPVDDASVLSSRADGVVVVASAYVTSRRRLARAIDALDEAGADIIGTVLNNAPGDPEHGSDGRPSRADRANGASTRRVGARR